MSHTNAQKLEITWLMEAFEVRKKRMSDSYGPGSLYENRLHEAGFHMAAFVVGTQGIEALIRLILEGYASKGRLLKILHEANPLEKIKLDSIDSEPLGSLIETFRQITGKSQVIDKLWVLNNHRIQVVHHIFIGNTKEDVEEYEKDIRKYTNSPEPTFIVENLTKELLKIDTQLKELSKDN